MPESRFHHIPPSGKPVSVASAAEALALMKTDGFIWLDFYQPGREQLEELAEPLGLHPLSIEDCVDTQQLPKIEDFPRNTFIIFNAFTYARKELKIDEIDLFIGENFVLSVSGVGSADRRPLAGIERLLEANIDLVQRGPALLMHLILDHVVDQEFTAIEALEDDIDTTEDALIADPGNCQPSELMRLRRSLLALRKSLYHEREILVKICRGDCPLITEKAIYRYRDVYDHLSLIFELTETYREIVTSLMELHASIINNLLAKAANTMNSTVRRLTLIATIFMPLTLLASIGGMSEWTMMTGEKNWKWSYPLFIAAMVVIGAVTYYVLRWLERKDKQ